jgi:hypothetical protein
MKMIKIGASPHDLDKLLKRVAAFRQACLCPAGLLQSTSCLHPIKRGIAANWLTRIEDFLNPSPNGWICLPGLQPIGRLACLRQAGVLPGAAN